MIKHAMTIAALATCASAIELTADAGAEKGKIPLGYVGCWADTSNDFFGGRPSCITEDGGWTVQGKFNNKKAKWNKTKQEVRLIRGGKRKKKRIA